MKISKKLLNDCLMINSSEYHQDEIAIFCGFNCQHCGFDRAVAAQRRQRILNEDWSYRTNDKGKEIAYLKINKEV